MWPNVQETKKTSPRAKQCYGSGSGSTRFWASWIRIHQSEVWIRIRIRILLSSCTNSKKNIDSYYFVTLFDFLSLENYVNVPSKSNKQRKCLNKNCFLLASWKSMTKIAGSGSTPKCPRSDPLVPRYMDFESPPPPKPSGTRPLFFSLIPALPDAISFHSPPFMSNNSKSSNKIIFNVHRKPFTTKNS